MPRTHSRTVPTKIWRDPEFTSLTRSAQYLWFVMHASPAGERPFDPRRVADEHFDGELGEVLDAEVALRRTRYATAFIPRRLRPHIPRATREAVFNRDGRRCVTCRSDESLSLDHIWPYSLGGDDSIDNLQTLCRPCNSRKGARV